MVGFYGIDKAGEMRFAVANSGIKNWAIKEGFDPFSDEYMSLPILLEILDETNFARFLAGEKNYKVIPSK